MMINKQILSRNLLCFCMLVIACAGTRAQDFVLARVLASEGEVEVRREASSRLRVQNVAFKVDDQLFAGDTIITGKSGRLVVGLSDGSQAVIAPKTTVMIKDLSNSPRTLFEVIKGKTRIQIEKRGGQPNPYRVNTPTAVIAVRGTIFDVLVDGEETQVYLHEGEVAVTNLAQPNRPVFLFAGQMTRVLIERLPNVPTAFKIGRNDPIFKMGRISIGRGSSQDSGRIADRGAKPEIDRGGLPPTGGPRPDPGRGSPPSKGPKQDRGSGGPAKRP